MSQQGYHYRITFPNYSIFTTSFHHQHQPCGSCGTGGIGGNGGSHTTKRMPMERTMSPIPTKGENMEFFWYAPSLYQGLKWINIISL